MGSRRRIPSLANSVEVDENEYHDDTLPKTIFHYTDKASIHSILEQKVLKKSLPQHVSWKAPFQSLHGGVYFTSLHPETSTSAIIRNNYQISHMKHGIFPCKVAKTEYALEFKTADLRRSGYNLKIPPIYNQNQDRDIWIIESDVQLKDLPYFLHRREEVQRHHSYTKEPNVRIISPEKVGGSQRQRVRNLSGDSRVSPASPPMPPVVFLPKIEYIPAWQEVS